MSEARSAFRLDDPHVASAAGDAAASRAIRSCSRRSRRLRLPVVVAPPLPRRRRFPWGDAVLVGAGGLVSLGLGLAVMRLIEDLFARAEWLGWLGLGLAAARRLRAARHLRRGRRSG